MDGAQAVPASIDLAAAFSPFWKVASVVEWAVDASEPMAAANGARFVWPEEPVKEGRAARQVRAQLEVAPAVPPADPTANSATIVTLQPMEIKTYLPERM